MNTLNAVTGAFIIIQSLLGLIGVTLLMVSSPQFPIIIGVGIIAITVIIQLPIGFGVIANKTWALIGGLVYYAVGAAGNIYVSNIIGTIVALVVMFLLFISVAEP